MRCVVLTCLGTDCTLATVVSSLMKMKVLELSVLQGPTSDINAMPALPTVPDNPGLPPVDTR